MAPVEPAALVLEGPSGAFEATHETIPLPAAATGLDLVRPDDAISIDVKVQTRGPRVVIHGRDRTSGDEAVVEVLPGDQFETRSLDGPAPAMAGVPSPVVTDSPVAILPMRLNRDAIPDRVILTHSGLTIEMSAPGATITVTNAADDGPGSLREAIAMTNASPGPDWIVFDIPGPGPHTIEPLTPLPEITDPVTIDGTTQPGYEGSPVIELSGAEAGENVSGLVVLGGSSVIRGLAINRFRVAQFECGGIALASQGSIVEGNHFGTDPSGTILRGNVTGISVGASENLIGGSTASSRNIISGNEIGLLTYEGSDNLIEGNFIGTDSIGMNPIGNETGIMSFLGYGNHVGGTPNLISGNMWGVRGDYSEGLLIQGNHVGIDVAGSGPLRNEVGIELSCAKFSMIGGPADGMGNVISGNETGVWLQERCTESNTIRGNYFGTDALGWARLAMTPLFFSTVQKTT